MSGFLTFASKTGVLVVSGLMMALLLLVVFPALPVVGGRLIDVLPGYGYDSLMALMADYGERGRRIHALATPTIDTLFPIVYVTLFAGLIHRLRPGAHRIVLIPFVLGTIDLCENAQITAMLLLYPDLPRALVRSASIFTLTKHILTLASLGAIVASGVTAWRNVRRDGVNRGNTES